MQQMSRYTESAAAAGCLHGSNPLFGNHGMVGTKDQLLNAGIEPGITSDCDIGFRRLLRKHFSLSTAHAFKDRRLTAIVLIYTNAEIDLPVTVIGTEHRHDADDRVWRELL
jgi:hypothetical protein